MTTAVLKLDGSDDQLRSLARWLREEDLLCGRIKLVDKVAQPGQMGGELAALAVAIGSGGMASVVIKSVFDWMKHKRDSAKISLTIRRADDEPGLEITCGSPDDLRAALDNVRKYLDGS